MNLLSISSFLNEATLTIDNKMLHRYQKEVYDLFRFEDENRYVLSAPTSFGKTYIVFEIIKKMNYADVLLVFPTISLLSENLIKLYEDSFFSQYSIHTLSEIDETEFGDKNIFIYTPERYLSFLDNNNRKFSFSFIDEIYKIDNDFIINNEELQENERDTAYRLALEYACRNSKDLLLSGPYIEFQKSENVNNSFNNFAAFNRFNIIEYNDVEIVAKNITSINKNRFKIGDSEYKFKSGTSSIREKIAQSVLSLDGNTIIYCGKKYSTENYAEYLLNYEPYKIKVRNQESSNHLYIIFLEHIESKFGSDWILYKALKNRIGIHNSGIPKYIQKEIINLFNLGELICLFSTTTITEGVNTTAKNIIITSIKKGKKDLKQFDAKNIAGRAGRFNIHYSGNVLDLTKDFEEIIGSQQETIEHKNYDINRNKNDVDLEVTAEVYMNKDDKELKDSIDREKEYSGLPDIIFKSYKTIGPLVKISIYNRIKKMTPSELRKIEQLKHVLNTSKGNSIHWEGFQTIVDLLCPFISDVDLKSIMERKVGVKGYSLIVIQLSTYLEKGFLGTVNYYYETKQMDKDKAIRNTARLIYTTFKYQLVKYLGVFDLLYRYHYSKIYRKDFLEVKGIQILLQRLEYNALTDNGRKLSDYGVPFEIVKFYEGNTLNKNFDMYEMYIDGLIQKLIE
ncbi:DEAD/DEAH box helicase family protein [Streptococcus uberis]|uniref:helicase-related protein n=1 Tax=Streptococcus uberis TaxID=1349 RepID=UPI001FF4C41C|nr:helicase-related protein [Streptococcus uberis]MCK1231705.1 DEAD/DEAH box helicase family protein [Streptococcus uberis]